MTSSPIHFFANNLIAFFRVEQYSILYITFSF
jgi:hypothetical protein